MSDSEQPTAPSLSTPLPNYQIRVKGHLDAHWSEWFEGMTISNEEDGTCVLSGLVADQAMLHGLLGKIRDLSLPLLAVSRLSAEPSD